METGDGKGAAPVKDCVASASINVEESLVGMFNTSIERVNGKTKFFIEKEPRPSFSGYRPQACEEEVDRATTSSNNINNVDVPDAVVGL